MILRRLILRYISYVFDLMLFVDLRRKFGEARQHPVVYYDVGSAGGPPALLRLLMREKLISFIGFEPGASTWANGKGWFDWFFRIPPYQEVGLALGAENAAQLLYVTRHPGCSSLLEPNEEVIANFENKEYFDVIHTERVEVVRLDHLIADKGLMPPEVIKMDTQGYEFSILVGLGQMLESVLCLQLEVHFKEVYRGEKTFSDIAKFLDQHGFRLIEIKRQGYFGDEFVEADTFWAKDVKSDRGKLVFEMWSRVHKLKRKKNYAQVRMEAQKYFIQK